MILFNRDIERAALKAEKFLSKGQIHEIKHILQYVKLKETVPENVFLVNYIIYHLDCPEKAKHLIKANCTDYSSHYLKQFGVIFENVNCPFPIEFHERMFGNDIAMCLN